MRSKDENLMYQMIEYINDEFKQCGSVPSVREIAKHCNVSKSCVSNYLAEMEDRGLINRNDKRKIQTDSMQKYEDVEFVPLVGTIACGTPMLAEENIERYLPIPKGLLGNGKHFALTAVGESMINAGINDGDCVIAKVQSYAEQGQIVVALIDDETTLKRYYLDEKRKQIRLHPENDNMKDMFFKKVEIQGVAVKIFKDLF